MKAKKVSMKVVLVVAALVITAGSLIVSQTLIADLKREENARMEIWAEAMRSLLRANENTDLNLVLRVINNNHTIPVVLLDERGEILQHRNIELADSPDSLQLLQRDVQAMQRAGRRMPIHIDEGTTFSLCYGESTMLKRLAVYPYIQLLVVALFIALAIYALLNAKRAEQNKVWVGLSRETAHQLGTPISSLNAWVAILEEQLPDDPTLPYLQQDIERLRLIADRFSKIGSAPDLEPHDLHEVVKSGVDYMRSRISDKVTLTLTPTLEPIAIRVCPPLFAWVIENLCKNAIDAMQGVGSIAITIRQTRKKAIVEVRDSGKGIAKNHFKKVFQPGFTTKKRGWGLGLSLAKRIVEEYHGGRIFVKDSELGKGTTFCIEMPLGKR